MSETPNSLGKVYSEEYGQGKAISTNRIDDELRVFVVWDSHDSGVIAGWYDYKSLKVVSGENT